MSMTTDYQLVADFKSNLNNHPSISLERTTLSRQVFRLISNQDVLLYVKGRAGISYKWGVTKNVIERLERQLLPWCVVLLFDTSETGYLLESSAVK